MNLFDGAVGAIKNAVGNQGMASSVLDMVNNHEGGLTGLVQTFKDKGMGGVVSSWVGTGANQPITAEQIQQVLGNERIQQFATQHGIDVGQVSTQLAQILPVIVDKLTPNGTIPPQS